MVLPCLQATSDQLGRDTSDTRLAGVAEADAAASATNETDATIVTAERNDAKAASTTTRDPIESRSSCRSISKDSRSNPARETLSRARCAAWLAGRPGQVARDGA